MLLLKNAGIAHYLCSYYLHYTNFSKSLRLWEVVSYIMMRPLFICKEGVDEHSNPEFPQHSTMKSWHRCRKLVDFL